MEKLKKPNLSKEYYSNEKTEEENINIGFLFKDGKILEFHRLILDKIDYSRETGALRIRTTPNEVDVDFLAEMQPTRA